MVKYTNKDKNESVIIGVVAPGIPLATTDRAEFMILKTMLAVGAFPVVSDILEPLPGVRLRVTERRYDMRGDEIYLWFQTEVVQ